MGAPLAPDEPLIRHCLSALSKACTFSSSGGTPQALFVVDDVT